MWDGTLDDFMDNNGRKVVPKLVMDKITGQVDKLHSLNHAHLDLHGANVLVKWDKTGKKALDATITDFGLAVHTHRVDPERLDLPIDLHDLKPTKDPKNIDRQMLQQMRGDYK
jgi:tRNA A-37 threonylcarbamoyl transferase component Bud32